ALRTVSGAAYRRGGRRANSGPGRVPARGDREARPVVTALEDDHLEQRSRSDHAEARQTLLAGLRVNSQRDRLGATLAGVMPEHTQHDLFGPPPADAEIVRAAVPDEHVVQVAARMPKNLHFGTSSWSFPGWVGIVYAQLYSASVLARYGLPAYARHPLLNAVNLDSTFYKVQTTEQLASYAADVPEHFRFMVKAYAGLTAAPDSSVAVRRRVEPVFLDARFAANAVVKPLVEALGTKLGALLFQFSPLGPRFTREPRVFAARLGEFLSALPTGPTYAVEVRDPEFLGS